MVGKMKPSYIVSRRRSSSRSDENERRMSSADKLSLSSSSSCSSFDTSLCPRRLSQSRQPNEDLRHEMDRQLGHPHDFNRHSDCSSITGASAQNYSLRNDIVAADSSDSNSGIPNTNSNTSSTNSAGRMAGTRNKSVFSYIRSNFGPTSAVKNEPQNNAGYAARHQVLSSHLTDVNHSAATDPNSKSNSTPNQCDNHSSFLSPSSSLTSPECQFLSDRDNRPHSLSLHEENLDVFPDGEQLGRLHEHSRHTSNGGDVNLKKHLTTRVVQSSHYPQHSRFGDYFSDGQEHPICSEPPESGMCSSPASLDHDHQAGNASLLPVSRDDGPASAPPLSSTGFGSHLYQKKSKATKPTQSATLQYLSQPNISPRAKGSGMRQQKSSSDLESLRQAFEHKLEPDNMKTKLMSVWNNIKYGWTFKGKVNFKLDKPIFLLGESYHKRSEDDSYTEHEFMKDFVSRIWFTYRSNFYPIPGSKFKSDCGWGCMLRSGQMLMAQCLLTHYLGRNWRMYNQQTKTELTFYREIIRWFSDPVDSPSDHFPLSLHHLVQFGRRYNKSPGEWYGPASVAYILRDALNRAGSTLPILGQLCVYVAQDCTVYLEDVNRLCHRKAKTDSFSDSLGPEHELQTRDQRLRTHSGTSVPWQRSLIMLIPVRLGGEVMNEVYSPCIQNLLSYRQCMGIIGGKPKHSLYFIGWQDEKLIYLDPHYCRDAIDTKTNNFPIETYHCMSPRKMPVKNMDPSCTIGFYLKNAEEFQEFIQEVQEYISPPNPRGSYPLFIFSRGSHEDASQAQEMIGVERGRVRVRHYRLDENGQRQPEEMLESEEFVML